MLLVSGSTSFKEGSGAIFEETEESSLRVEVIKKRITGIGSEMVLWRPGRMMDGLGGPASGGVGVGEGDNLVESC